MAKEELDKSRICKRKCSKPRFGGIDTGLGGKWILKTYQEKRSCTTTEIKENL